MDKNNVVRRICKNCAIEREYTEEEKNIMNKIAGKYGMEYDFTDKKTFQSVGCEKCNNTGFYGRIGIFEILSMTDVIKDLIVRDASTIEIKNKAIEEGYRPLLIDGFNKVLNGYTTLDELNSKLVFY